MDRIALSPLTATVLLIVFAVALGAVVLSYGETFIDAEVAQVTEGICPSGCVRAPGLTGAAILSVDNSEVDFNRGYGA